MSIHGSRRLIGTLLGLIAAVAAVWSAFLSWYAGREGSNIRIQDLFEGITLDSASTMNSVFLPLAFAALLCLVYAIVGWRSLLVLGGLVCLATTLLWAIRQAQTAAGLQADLVGWGPQLAAGAGVLMIIAAAVAPAVKRRHRQKAPDSEGGTIGQKAYAAGYRDAQVEVGSGAQTERLTGQQPTPAQQPPSEPRIGHDGPNT